MAAEERVRRAVAVAPADGLEREDLLLVGRDDLLVLVALLLLRARAQELAVLDGHGLAEPRRLVVDVAAGPLALVALGVVVARGVLGLDRGLVDEGHVVLGF